MKTKAKLFCVVVTLLITMNCKYNIPLSDLTEKRAGVFKSDKDFTAEHKFQWIPINLPLYGNTIVSHNDLIYVVGTDGIITLTPELNVESSHSFSIIEEYISQDGGITIKPFNQNKKTNLCSPEEAYFLSDYLYVFSLCEHTSQLWKIKFNETAQLTSINFTYSNSTLDDYRVFGPTGLAGNKDKIMIPAFIKNRPALLTKNIKTNNLEVVWQGEINDSNIVSVDFMEENGWILLGNGKIFHSIDNGVSWQYLMKLQLKPEDSVTGLKFKDKNKGYIIGDNLLYLTEDNGKTWSKQEISDDFLYEIEFGKNIEAIRGDHNLFIKKDDGIGWDEIKTKPKGNIKDLLIKDDKLFILIDGKLYFTKFD